MSGESDLAVLLHSLSPELHPGEYVFCTFAQADPPPDLAPLCTFREAEGWTLILPRAEADQLGMAYDFVAAWITLTVHSDLAAVGLTAAISSALAQTGISCNVVAAFYHDHLFVPLADARRALSCLRALSERE